MEITDKAIKKEKEASEEIEQLILDLKDEDTDVRWGAEWTLGNMKDMRAVKALIEALKGENWTVREGAAKALVKIGELAVEPLVEALEDKHESVKKAVKEALEKIKAQK
jgi:bilin biosynthesis protein